MLSHSQTLDCETLCCKMISKRVSHYLKSWTEGVFKGLIQWNHWKQNHCTHASTLKQTRESKAELFYIPAESPHVILSVCTYITWYYTCDMLLQPEDAVFIRLRIVSAVTGLRCSCFEAQCRSLLSASCCRWDVPAFQLRTGTVYKG